MKHWKRVLFGLGILAAAQVLCFLQLLLEPKYMDENRDGAMIPEYYRQAGGHDVIFVGDCEVYENISPVVLWQEFGIPGYVRGSPQQMIWQSCCLLEETFRYETPEVVVFNVLSMKYDSPESTGDPARREAYNRMTLDGMRWSACKWKAIYASMTEQERELGSVWTYLFPLLRYHDRWHQLEKEDFTYLFHRDRVTDCGYLMQTGVRPLRAAHPEKPLADYRFGENSWTYLDRIRRLCEEHGSRLVLMKAPSLYPVWWEEWEAQIEAYAETYDLPYYNFLEVQEDIGIDWETDTYDTGLHLNVWGAEKLTRYFGRILREDLGLEDRRGDGAYDRVWQEYTEAYEARKLALTGKDDDT